MFGKVQISADSRGADERKSCFGVSALCFSLQCSARAVPTLIKEVINELCPSRWLYYLYPADKYNYKAEVIKRNPEPGVTQFCVYSSVRERKRLNPVFQSQTGALPLRGQARPHSEVPAVFSRMLLPRAVNQKLAACLDNASCPRMRQLPGNPGISSGWAGMSCSLSSPRGGRCHRGVLKSFLIPRVTRAILSTDRADFGEEDHGIVWHFGMEGTSKPFPAQSWEVAAPAMVRAPSTLPGCSRPPWTPPGTGQGHCPAQPHGDGAEWC